MSRSIALAHRAPRPILMAARFASFVSLARQRAALQRLDDAQLRDIGLTRDNVRREANRPFWDVPQSGRS